MEDDTHHGEDIPTPPLLHVAAEVSGYLHHGEVQVSALGRKRPHPISPTLSESRGPSPRRATLSSIQPWAALKKMCFRRDHPDISGFDFFRTTSSFRSSSAGRPPAAVGPLVLCVSFPFAAGRSGDAQGGNKKTIVLVVFLLPPWASKYWPPAHGSSIIFIPQAYEMRSTSRFKRDSNMLLHKLVNQKEEMGGNLE